MNDLERKDWLEARRKVMGASDTAAVMGYGYGSPLRVWLSKVHPEMLEDDGDRELLEFGLDVEPAIARAYERATGRLMCSVIPTADKHGIVRHPDYPEIACTPDRQAVDGRLVQLKWQSKWADKFGDPGTDAVPDGYLIQCAQEMAVVGVEFEDIATLHAGPPLLIYPLRRDRELEKVVIDAARAFWADYVIPKKEPPIDASKDWAAYIEKKWPHHRGEMRKVGPVSEQAVYADGLWNVLKAIAPFEEDAEELRNHLKSFIGDADGIEGDFGKITWRRTKDTKRDVVDWETVASALSVKWRTKDVVALIEAHTQRNVVVRRGSRRFVANFK